MKAGRGGPLSRFQREGGKETMKHDQRMTGDGRTILLGLMAGILAVSVMACSSEQPKPMVQPTPDQVRNHADRAFDKLKQEEQERAANPSVP
jgi:hypothetical protein